MSQTNSALAVGGPTDPDMENLPVAIDNFLELLQRLISPSVQRIDGEYHLRGPVSNESLERLSEYLKRVASFTLTDNALTSIPPITLSCLVQLITRYHSHENIESVFPALTEFRVVDANKTLAHLPLFTVPSVRYLEITKVPEAQCNALVTFIHALASVAQDLRGITFDGPFPYQISAHPACMRFTKLRNLSLENVEPGLNWTTLRDIGQLPMLQTFVLFARNVKYSRESVPDPPFIADTARPSVPHSSTSAEYNPAPEHLRQSTEKQKTERPSPVVGFFHLKELHIEAEIDLLSDLVDLIGTKVITVLDRGLFSEQSVKSTPTGGPPWEMTSRRQTMVTDHAAAVDARRVSRAF